MDAETMALRDSLLLVVWMRPHSAQTWDMVWTHWGSPNVVSFLELMCKVRR